MTPADIKVAPKRTEEERESCARRLAPKYAKGDVWVVAESKENPPVGTEMWANRPAVIVSSDLINRNSGNVVVVYLTTSTLKRSGPTHIEVPGESDGVRALALCEQLHTVDVSRLRRKKGSLPGLSIKEIDEAIALTLSLGRRPDSNPAFTKWENYIKSHSIDMRQEIEALSAKTVDQRVDALTRALEHLTAERDAFRTLYESVQSRPAIMHDVVTSITANNTSTPHERNTVTAAA